MNIVYDFTYANRIINQQYRPASEVRLAVVQPTRIIPVRIIRVLASCRHLGNDLLGKVVLTTMPFERRENTIRCTGHTRHLERVLTPYASYAALAFGNIMLKIG